MRRLRRATKIAIAAFVLLWIYWFGFDGEFETARATATVTVLDFPAGTFSFAEPFFYHAGSPRSLFVAGAPPDTLAAGARVWRLTGGATGISAAEARPEPGSLYTPAQNALVEDAGPCGAASAGEFRVEMKFAGVHFRKPVLRLFSLDGAPPALRMVEVYFGWQEIRACRGTEVIAAFARRLWNIPSGTVLADLAFHSAMDRALFITGDATGRNRIRAVRY
jgi:hypothetical protein